MGDLISRKALLEEINNFSLKIGGSVNAMALVVMGETKKSIAKMIENQPTAFDLESVIAKLKSIVYRIDDSATLCSRDVINEEDVFETLNSAANATNGKIGE